MKDAGFIAYAALASLVCAVFAWRRKGWQSWASGLLLYSLAAFLGAAFASGSLSFSFIRRLSHAIFEGLPLYFLLSAWALGPKLKRASLAAGLLVALIGIYAQWIEPRWLQTRYYSVASPLIKEPLRIVVLADIQTDRITDYERKALLKARSLQPDLVLFPGDYIQEGDPARRAALSSAFNALLKEVGLKPRLGAFAVQGDMEDDHWPELFQGTGVRPLTQVLRLNVGPLELVSLPLHASRIGVLLPPKRKFRVVFGHAPDYALHRTVDADLLIAGHTHGGQVRIPFFGPLITLSRVPRDWAGGKMVELDGGRRLIVSRGIGHERGPAPRLRFNCRPEVVVVDLVAQ